MIEPAVSARLEAAEAGSRELDGLIAKEVGWHRVQPRFARNKHGGWIAPEDFIGLYSDGSPKLDSLHGTDIHRDPPRVTQSIDAALALAERVLPGWPLLWRTDEERGFMANTWKRGGDPNLGDPCFPSYSTTPALALCIAILRAKQGEGE